MSVVPVKKVRLAVHCSASEDLTGFIQSLGCCEMIPATTATSDGVRSIKNEDLQAMELLEDSLSELRSTLRFLQPFHVEEQGVLERMLSDKPSVTMSQLADLYDRTQILEIVSEARCLEKRLAEIHSLLPQLTEQLKLLRVVKSFHFPLSLISRGTEQISGFMGTVPADRTDDLINSFQQITGKEGDYFQVQPDEKDPDVYMALLFLKEREQSVRDLCSSLGFAMIELSEELIETPSRELERIQKEEISLRQEERSLHDRAVEHAHNWVPVIRKLVDYQSVVQKKLQTLNGADRTEQVSILWFWIPSDMLPRLESLLKRFSAVTDVEIMSPGTDDNPPSIMANPAWARPYEPLTKLYGLPMYGGIDPTVYMGPFFFLFFGMCLGDAGYGLVMVILSLMALLKFPMSGDKKHFSQLLLIGGVGSVIFGALTGSFFGDLFSTFKFLEPLARFQRHLVILEPMNDPMTLLAISLSLGVFQIFFGMTLVLVENLRKGDYIAAFGDQVGWFMFLIGLGGMVIGSGYLSGRMMLVAKIMALCGGVVLVLTQGREKKTVMGKLLSGALSLYNVMSYLGDILSYSRLLALGLATMAIAMIFNMLASMIGGIPYVGWLIAVVFFLLGHVFAFAINVMGAFVHALRLQYVEFFSKFYTGGGRPFTPFRYNTQHVLVVEEEHHLS